jgi:hypothetical protein
MKHSIKKDKNSFEPNWVHIKKIQDGIYFVHIDFNDRIECIGEGSEDGCQELYFEQDSRCISIAFDVEDYMIVGSTCKRFWHGTFYRRDIYEKLFEEIC